jgi:hypothetical protein
MRIDERDALASICVAVGHHLDELHISLLALLRFVVCCGGEGGASASHGRNSEDDGNASIDESDLPSSLGRAFAKAIDFFKGQEQSSRGGTCTSSCSSVGCLRPKTTNR